MSKIVNRFQASAIHFLFSLAIFSVLIYTVLAFWYPEPYFSASGGWQGLKIIIMVGLVLGPLLTLVVFNKRKQKKELFFDIGVIITLQLSALVWGIYTMHEQRPVAAVFWDGYFYTVSAADIKEQQFSVDQLKEFGDDFPVYVYTAYPENIKQWQDILNYMLSKKQPPYLQTERYSHLSGNYENIFKKSINIREIIAINQDIRADLEKLLEQTDTQLENNYYIPLESKYRNVILVFDTSNNLIGTVNSPYKNN